MVIQICFFFFFTQLENCLALGGTLTFEPSTVSDGNAIADCLVQLAPDFFTVTWRGKIIAETGGNWKLRVSRLDLDLICCTILFKWLYM